MLGLVGTNGALSSHSSAASLCHRLVLAKHLAAGAYLQEMRDVCAGIGKSTALKVLAGKLKPNLGRFEARDSRQM